MAICATGDASLLMAVQSERSVSVTAAIDAAPARCADSEVEFDVAFRSSVHSPGLTASWLVTKS